MPGRTSDALLFSDRNSEVNLVHVVDVQQQKRRDLFARSMLSDVA
jgi:hypothetical protein